jgi:hypothetical protein
MAGFTTSVGYLNYRGERSMSVKARRIICATVGVLVSAGFVLGPASSAFAGGGFTYGH